MYARHVTNRIWNDLRDVWRHALVEYLLDNWQISGITAFASGQPCTNSVACSTGQPNGVTFSTVDSMDIAGGGDGARLVLTGNPTLQGSQRSIDRWFDPTVFARPARGDFGNAPKDVYRLPGVNNWDLSFFKNVRLKKEERYLQLRWEVYNFFNHTQFSGVDSAARFDASGRQINRRFGAVTTARSARTMQASVRFTF